MPNCKALGVDLILNLFIIYSGKVDFCPVAITTFLAKKTEVLLSFLATT